MIERAIFFVAAVVAAAASTHDSGLVRALDAAIVLSVGWILIMRLV